MRLNKLKFFIISLVFVFIGFLSTTQIKAQEPEVQMENEVQPAQQLTLYLFYSSTCPHCTKEKPFLGMMEKEWEGKLKILAFEVSEKRSVQAFQTAAEVFQLNSGSVPVTIIGEQVFAGYGNHEGSGKEMREAVTKCLSTDSTGCDDILAAQYSDEIIAVGGITWKNEQRRLKKEIDELYKEYIDVDSGENSSQVKKNLIAGTVISVPFWGELDAKDLSLPVLAVLVGFLDGFNPCAMWVLLFLISLLLGIEDKRRRWLYGVVFIAASAFVYFLFMTAWLNAFLLLGVVPIVRLSIALFALGVGAYHAYDYFKHGDNCKVTQGEEKKQTFEKLKKVVMHPSVWVAIIGLVTLAFAVNLVELMCSAGFPAIFTSILAMSNLATWQYYAYIFIYLVLFMIDDIIVFTIAMLTLESHIVGEKYSKYSKIIGAILMLIIGVLLLLKPELLMFG